MTKIYKVLSSYENNIKELLVMGDSELVIKQMKG